MDRVEYRKGPDGRMVPRQNQIQFVLLLGGLLAAILLTVAALAYRTVHRWQPPIAPLSAARILVRNELQPAPGDQVYFSPKDETNIRRLSDGSYMIQGWVDQISPAGQAQRIDFSCTIKENAAGDWLKERLNFFPQS